MEPPAPDIRQATDDFRIAFALLGKAMSLLAYHPTPWVGLLLIFITILGEKRASIKLGVILVVQVEALLSLDDHTDISEPREELLEILPRVHLYDAALIWAVTALPFLLWPFARNFFSNVWARCRTIINACGASLIWSLTRVVSAILSYIKPSFLRIWERCYNTHGRMVRSSWPFTIRLLVDIGFAIVLIKYTTTFEVVLESGSYASDEVSSKVEFLNWFLRVGVVIPFLPILAPILAPMLEWHPERFLRRAIERMILSLVVAFSRDTVITRSLELLASVSLVLSNVMELQVYCPTCFWICNWACTLMQLYFAWLITGKWAITSFVEAVVCIQNIHREPSLGQLVLICANLLPVAFSLAEYLRKFMNWACPKVSATIRGVWEVLMDMSRAELAMLAEPLRNEGTHT